VRGLLGVTLCAITVLVALLAPALAPTDPLAQDITARLRPPVWHPLGLPAHPLGTDQLGRDLLSRVIYGARPSLVVALAAVALAAIAGVSLGLLAGYYSGAIDQLSMRLADIQLAFPFLLLAITLMAVFPPTLTTVILVLALSGWVTYARLVRAQVLTLREKEFVIAARTIGSDDARVLLRHVLPNVLPIITIVGTVQVAQFILAEAALSFLGLGIRPPTPSWGNIINEGQEYIFQAWWIETFPGLAIVAAVSGVGLLGDWLRDALDPRLRV
jgi:peptide/nickel transport system permease protein